MKTLFTNNQFEGIMVFSHKDNWTTILTFLDKLLGRNQFFFFFDSERGYHLKIFSKNFQSNQLEEIYLFLKTLPISATTSGEDPFFSNIPENSLHYIQYIPQSIDINYHDNLTNDVLDTFLNKLSSVVIDALRYNNFFIEEKHRINFAIQLIFMALVRADKEKIKQELAEVLENLPNKIEHNSPLVEFFKDVQEIESEEKIEAWVINWLNTTADFLSTTTLQTLVESICTTLEIRGFVAQLLYTTQTVLLYSLR